MTFPPWNITRNFRPHAGKLSFRITCDHSSLGLIIWHGSWRVNATTPSKCAMLTCDDIKAAAPESHAPACLPCQKPGIIVLILQQSHYAEIDFNLGERPWRQPQCGTKTRLHLRAGRSLSARSAFREADERRRVSGDRCATAARFTFTANASRTRHHASRVPQYRPHGRAGFMTRCMIPSTKTS